MTKAMLAGILAIGLCSTTALAETAGGVSWTAPVAWKSQGARPMRAMHSA